MTGKTLKDLAKNLANDFPRSPRRKLGPYIIGLRTLDKCRAEINGSIGEYHFDCPLDKIFFEFTGITADTFKEMAATGATDDAMAAWVEANATPREKIEIIKWNNEYRYKRISEMPDAVQEFLEGYIDEYIPEDKVVYYWFDVYDIEEKRI